MADIRELENKLNTLKGEERLKILPDIGDIFLDSKKYHKAIKSYLEAVKLFKKKNNKKRLSPLYINIGIAHNDIGNYEQARNFFQKALVVNQEINNKKISAFAYNNLGLVFMNLGNYDKALDYFFKALVIFDEVKSKMGVAKSYNNIGNVYSHLKNYEKALEFALKSLEIKQKLGNKEMLANSLHNTGRAYSNLKKNKTALKYYMQSLKIFEEIGEKSGMAISLNNIGIILGKQSKFNDAIKYYLRSLKLKEDIGDKFGIANTSNNIGDSFRVQSKYDEALFYLRKGLKQAMEINAMDLVKSSYKKFSDLFSNQHDYQNAYKYFKQYIEIKDKIFNEESTKKIAELQTKYETEKKEREAEIYKLKNVELRKKNKQITKQKDLLQKAKKELKEINKNLEKRVQEELQKKEQQRQLLIQKSKLESLGKLSAGIAHEINQPLGGIAMGIDNIIHKNETNTLTDDYLNQKCHTLFEHIRRIEKIIEHIRVFSRDQQSTLKERINVNETIENALSMVQIQYKNHNIDIIREINKQPLFCQGNRFKLEQVILNLLSNAKDAVDSKEQINLGYLKKIFLRSYQKDHQNIIEIEDNGIGIPEENLHSIFDPFFTSKVAEQGTGLGLSISYGIIKEMKGKITAESKPGEFTKMRIILRNDEIEVKK